MFSFKEVALLQGDIEKSWSIPTLPRNHSTGCYFDSNSHSSIKFPINIFS